METRLPQTGCDRSIRAITQYLYLRIQGEPAPAAYQHPIDETDEEEEHDDYNDEFLGINAGGYTAAAREYLCKDFRHIIDAGFRPGFTRISDLGESIEFDRFRFLTPHSLRIMIRLRRLRLGKGQCARCAVTKLAGLGCGVNHGQAEIYSTPAQFFKVPDLSRWISLRCDVQR